MQGRIRQHDAADRHRLKLGDRRERAGATDLDLDRLDDRCRLFGRKFMGDGPARRARHEAEPLLPVEPVDFVDDAVDVVVERGALRLDVAMEREKLLDRRAKLHQRIDPKAARREPVQHRGLGVGRHRAHLAGAVGEEAERPRRGDGGIELT